MGCVELCGVVHTVQRQTSLQIPIGLCANLLMSVSVSVPVFVSVSVNAPLYLVAICLLIHFSIRSENVT